MEHENDKSSLIDEVRAALKRALISGQKETVVFYLSEGKRSGPPTPTQTEQLAQKVLKDATDKQGHSPTRTVIFDNLGSMVVQADAKLLLHLLDNPLVTEATLNPPVEPVQPVRKSPAKSKDGHDLPE